METKILPCDADSFAMAGALLRAGQLVVFPTETVYGLGANGLDQEAVLSVFAAKGRPADNPLIEHIASWDMLKLLTPSVPPKAMEAMRAFWPGPMTCVLPASGAIPPAVNAGLPSVAVRWPSDENAQAVIRAAEVPVAAPSANLSGRPSPTCARDAASDMNGRVPLILDGGDCRFGLESTVVSFLEEVPQILRPGAVTPDMLESVVGPVRVHPAALAPLAPGEKAASPGMLHKHYAPRAHVTVFTDSRRMLARYDELCARGKNPWLLCEDALAVGPRRALRFGQGSADYAAALFRGLRALDSRGADYILCMAVEAKGMGLAVMNRLLRAANYDVDRREAP